MAELRSLPDDMTQLGIAFRYQIRFFLRSYRALAAAILMLAIVVLILAINFYNGAAHVQAQYQTAAAYMAGELGFFGLAIPIVAAMLGGDAIATDFGSSTGYYVLVLPVRRPVLLLGRYLAAVSIGVGVMAIYFLGVLGGAAYFFGIGSIPGGDTLITLGLALLVVVAYVAFAFLLSSLFRRPVVSTIVVLLLLLLVFPLVTMVLTTFGIEPWFMIDYGAGALTQALVPSPHSGTLVTEIGRNQTITVHFFNAYVWQGALILFAYLVVSLVGSIVIYERKEVKG